MLRRRLRALYRRARVSVRVARRFGLGGDQLELARLLAAGALFTEHPDEEHLDAALQWLCRAQDACSGRGVSACFDLAAGWQVAYPETSGYIIGTYLAYADRSSDTSFVERARQLGDWEVALQTPSGGVLSHPERPHTRVFNTGQVILGWCALFENTGEDAYLRAARRAGDYLVALQEPDGSWVRDTHCGARTYHARVAWSLLRLSSLSACDAYAEAARRNLSWVIGRQLPNGWFDACGFDVDLPITHVIGYTLRGLLESHLSGRAEVREHGLLDAVVRAADALSSAIAANPVLGHAGMVPASFDRHWNGTREESCLTGNAQLACAFYRLAHAVGREHYKTVADTIVRITKRTQLLETRFDPVRGGLAGSFPFASGYHANSYPNWATKFLADALLMKLGFLEKRTVTA